LFGSRASPKSFTTEITGVPQGSLGEPLNVPLNLSEQFLRHQFQWCNSGNTRAECLAS
jgi:hypothetical protein